MKRLLILWLQAWGWISDIGKVKPVVLDGSEALRMIHAQFFEAQMKMLEHAALAEYHGSMQEMLFFRRKRLNEDPFCTKYYEPEEEDLPLVNVPMPPTKKTH